MKLRQTNIQGTDSVLQREDGLYQGWQRSNPGGSSRKRSQQEQATPLRKAVMQCVRRHNLLACWGACRTRIPAISPAVLCSFEQDGRVQVVRLSLMILEYNM